jgi:hypothetical protein
MKTHSHVEEQNNNKMVKNFVAYEGRRQLFFFFLEALEFELRASHLLGRHFYHLSHSASPFLVMGFFKIGSYQLFAWGWL